MTGSRWERIARAGAGEAYAASYADRFRQLAAQGADVHGEASFVAALRPVPARVLDAGCGTGRVALRLAEMGYDVVGIDADATMLAEARADGPDLTWIEGDLAGPALAEILEGQRFDLVLLAGNVVPLLEEGTLDVTVGAMAAHLVPGGLFVAGFGLDADHLPAECPVTPIADWAFALAHADLEPVSRHGGWDGSPFDMKAGYLVSVDQPR